MDSDEPRKLLRIKSIIGPHGPICVSKSTWWAGVRSGRYPAPIRLGTRVTAWRADDIARLTQDGVKIDAKRAKARKSGGGK